MGLVIIMFSINYNEGGYLGTIQWTPPAIGVLTAYALLSPLVFFVPLSTAHDSMLKAKEREILIISKQFEETYKIVKNTLSSQSSEIKEALDKIEQLKRIHGISQSLPVWPFNYQNL